MPRLKKLVVSGIPKWGTLCLKINLLVYLLHQRLIITMIISVIKWKIGEKLYPFKYGLFYRLFGFWRAWKSSSFNLDTSQIWKRLLGSTMRGKPLKLSVLNIASLHSETLMNFKTFSCHFHNSKIATNMSLCRQR